MKTKHITIYLILFFVYSCNEKKSELGKAIISETIPVYENEDNYFPHDGFMKSDLLEHPIEVTKSNKTITISNIFNDGFTGHQVNFKIDRELNITEASYRDWTDVIDGSETKHMVQKIILDLDKNPFTNQNFSGYYTLQIKHNFSAGKIFANEGIKDTTYYSTFNGKFKIYNKEELIKGKEWIINQNEIKDGIKDSLGIYSSPDKFAEFKLDESVLKKALNDLKIKKGEIQDSTRRSIILTFTVDENGLVDKDKIHIRGLEIPKNLMQKIKDSKLIFENWKPAEHKGETVKSDVNLRIQIEK